ncbi:hypothetical protein QBC34DRAFT_499353 [Podospora aff. communis PSN243]|uniref:Uncharacterized protein n=1 Tax=Podospora aff. communis PSN243 TaxID=3040156 RepID=A0AAV9G189_9PEZI|nr:hypothetical protein QBC34DRAFT_499353 [Podospora aff. communis PSN243]
MHLTRATLAIALAASATALPVNDKPNLPVEESRTHLMPGGTLADKADKTPRSLSSHFGFAQGKSGMPGLPTEEQTKQQPDNAPRSFHFVDSEGKQRMPDNGMDFEHPAKEPRSSHTHFNLAQGKSGFNPTNEGSRSGGSWEGGNTDRVEGLYNNDKVPRSHQALVETKPPGFIGTGVYATPEGRVPTMQKRQNGREGHMLPTEQRTNPGWKGQNGEWSTFNGAYSGRKDGYDAPLVQRSKGDNSRDGHASYTTLPWGTDNSGRKDGYDAPAAGRWTSAEGHEWGLDNADRKDGLTVTLAGGRKDGYDAPVVQRDMKKGDAPWTGGQEEAAFPIPPWVTWVEAGHGRESAPLGAIEAEKKGELHGNGFSSRPGWTGSAKDGEMKPGAKMDYEMEPRDVVRGAGMDAVQGEYPAAHIYRERKGSSPLDSLMVGGDEGSCPNCSME